MGMRARLDIFAHKRTHKKKVYSSESNIIFARQEVETI